MSARFQERPARDLQDRWLTIAIDYGTSATKLAFREHEAKDTILVPGPAGQSTWPSVVEVADGKLYFPSTQPRPGARSAKWLKIALADSPGADNGFGARILERFGCPADILATMFLAYVIQTVRTMAQRHLGPRRITYNLAAPLDATSEPEVRERFDRALFLSVRLADQVVQGWNLQEAVATYKSIAHQYATIPPMQERDTFVIPETHAAMIGLVLSNRLDDDHYAVIDIGAGTTDIAIFLYYRKGTRPVVYESARTALVGGRDADQAIATGLGGQAIGAETSDEDLVEAIRASKEQMADGRLRLQNDMVYSKEEVDSAVEEVCQKLFSHYQKTWGAAFEKEKRASNWKNLNVLLVGGGSQFGPFSSCLGRSPYKHVVRDISIKRIKLTGRFRVARGEKIVSFDGDDHLLTVVHGLAYHYARIPQWWEPRELKPLPHPTVQYEPPNDDSWRG